MKLGRISPLTAILLLGLFLATTAIASNLSQGLSRSSSTKVSKLQVCPDKWYKNEQPCVYQSSPVECEKQRREYFVIDGERKEIEEMDVGWIIENCEVNKPEVIY